MRALDLPPVWTLGFGAAMWLVARIAPWPVGDADWFGGGLILAAIALTIWTVATFRKSRTTIIPRQAPRAFVTDGPMRICRNPIYLADALALAGWGFILGAAAPFLLIPVFMRVIERRFIIGEEARLMAAFGASYSAYAARVRRWF